MILDAEGPVFHTGNTLDGVVQQIDVGDLQRRVFQTLRNNGIAVVLGRDFNFGGGQVLYRVVAAPVTELQLIGIAAVGMYFICINEDFSINKGDFYTLICAICFAAQIIAVDKVIANLDGVRLSLVQFATCTLLNGVLMFIFESPSLTNVLLGWLPIAYAGIMSSGVAYTLQIVGQKHCNPVLACMIMSLESAFALLSGWLLLGQAMTSREIFGCVLVFAAIMLAQIPPNMLPWNKN